MYLPPNDGRSLTDYERDFLPLFFLVIALGVRFSPKSGSFLFV
jgi:hypothetical protein